MDDLTPITADEFLALYNEYDGEPEDCPQVYTGPEQVEMKLMYQELVFQRGKQHFQITLSEDNTGYWGDGNSYPPECVEVVPQTKEITVYVPRLSKAKVAAVPPAKGE